MSMPLPTKMAIHTPPPLPGTPHNFGGGVPHGSQNPDPISDQNILFFIPLSKSVLIPIPD